MPANMALPSFMVVGATHIRAEAECMGETIVLEEDDEICLEEIKSLDCFNSSKRWNTPKEVSITVSVWSDEHPDGIRYAPFTITLSPDSIDRYLTYRLIPPGYEGWHCMGIYRRDLTTYDEETVSTIDEPSQGCVNCHTPMWGNPQRTLYHRRGEGGGTVFNIDGKEYSVNLAALGMQGSYPAWHPSGRYVVFASTDTHQSFYHSSRDKIEVYDLGGRMFVYSLDSLCASAKMNGSTTNTANNIKRAMPSVNVLFNDSTLWHTFPTFSPDGRTLYFCRANAVTMPHQVDSLQYSLFAATFNAETMYADSVREVIAEGSVSFPRVSPDGRFLMFTQSDCGTFPIWHKEADLKMVTLPDYTPIDMSALNSNDVESYHSWSSNSRWVVFSSRRDDGRFTRLYIAHIDTMGNVSKPFRLPQKSPQTDILRLCSYNIPELMR